MKGNPWAPFKGKFLWTQWVVALFLPFAASQRFPRHLWWLVVMVATMLVVIPYQWYADTQTKRHKEKWNFFPSFCKLGIVVVVLGMAWAAFNGLRWSLPLAGGAVGIYFAIMVLLNMIVGVEARKLAEKGKWRQGA